jgi:predicted metal-binding membrane protein
MAVLFVAGIMNLLWVAAVAAFVLGEKIVPSGEFIGRTAGIVLVIVGFGFLVL